MRQGKLRVVIVGGGFAGLTAARRLGNDFNIVIIDRNNYHLFQPLLYQVATGYLGPGDIAGPLRSVLVRQESVQVIRDEVIDFDLKERRVITKHDSYPFDYMILSTGVTHSYFGNEAWEPLAPGLKTIDDAIEIRARVLKAFEEAERTTDPVERKQQLTFVIVGGGPTGVELAGTLAELARGTLRGEFRNFRPEEVQINLIEAGPRLLSTFHPSSSSYTKKTLEKLGVKVMTGARVIGISDSSVQIRSAEATDTIETRTVLWAAGIAASPLARTLAEKTSSALDNVGRIKVAPDLSIPGYPHLFVLGDLAYVENASGSPLPGIAPVAIQQGTYAAKLLRNRLRKRDTKPFRYLDKGMMAVIGRGRAVAESWRLRFTGFLAWLAWAFIHIYFLIDFENKVIVFFHWAWNYITNRRGSRLITRD